ncbi:MAG TPA: hypothetical protein PLR41_03895 [Alphaproteobacteria bacterium]|nr:hypothetical protein [Alphaproteobacteria bacterium]
MASLAAAETTSTSIPMTGADFKAPIMSTDTSKGTERRKGLTEPTPTDGEALSRPAAVQQFQVQQEPQGIQNAVKASVLELLEGSVVLRCLVEPNPLRIQVPRDLVPAALQRVGQTVTVTLSRSTGVRYPVIAARPIEPHELNQAERDAIGWVDKL